ncbi:MAG: ribonuclease Z [Anaerolineae bacterium]|nr:ribonuclease Z [Anaerolineae bacterium]
MFEIVFLGTSASAPTIERGLSSAIVLHREYRFMIDCGEGTQRQLLTSGLGFKRLDKILLTHGHLDHILGLGGLISTLGRWEMIPDIDLYAGRWPLQRIEELMNVVFGTVDNLPVKVNLHAIELGVLFSDDKFELRAVPVSHRGPGCFGFIFEEKQKRPFLVEKAEMLGVPLGPIRRELVQGNTVTLADGRLVQPEEVLGPAAAGAKLAVIGDAGRIDNLVEQVAGAGALVIESTYLEEDAAMARKFGHLTATRAAQLARDAGVRSLILNHVSRRYSRRQILAEARAVFEPVFVANDFDRFRVVKNMPAELIEQGGPWRRDSGGKRQDHDE